MNKKPNKKPKCIVEQTITAKKANPQEYIYG